MTIRVLVVDDEPLARAKLLRLLRSRHEATVVATARSVQQAIEEIGRTRPDLLFLDVQLPDGDGFAVLEAVGTETVPAVVFVTAYDEYALRAFEAHAIDYLLKPFDAERFARAYDRACAWLSVSTERPRPGLDALLARMRQGAAPARPAYATRVVVPEDHGEIVIPCDRIDWFESAGNYVEVHHDGRSHLLRETLAAVEARLDPARFGRVHRRVIVNLASIQKLTVLPSGDGIVTLRHGNPLRVSRRYRVELRSMLSLATSAEAEPPVDRRDDRGVNGG